MEPALPEALRSKAVTKNPSRSGPSRHYSSGKWAQSRRRPRDPDASRSGRGSTNQDRKSVVQGKSVSVRVALGGRRIIKKKTNKKDTKNNPEQKINIVADKYTDQDIINTSVQVIIPHHTKN